MRRTIKISLSILLTLLLIFLLLTPVFAKDNYVVIIDDREDLLTEQEELSLRAKMENITAEMEGIQDLTGGYRVIELHVPGLEDSERNLVIV